MGGSFDSEKLAAASPYQRRCDRPPRTPSSPLAMEPSEEVGKPFHCVICLELVYKPIVQSCGHVFCFWCVHRAMDNRRHSHCPVCRRPYMHFPRVCELLHFMLLKAVPEEYERRRKEIQRMEEESQVFSPRFLQSPKQTWSPRKLELSDSVKPHQWLNVQSSSCTSSAKLPVAGPLDEDNVEQAGVVDTRTSYAGIRESRQATGNCFRILECEAIDSESNILTVDDFLCSSCKRLLYRPVVLNCGEVFCESCLERSTGKALRCPSCDEAHRGGSVLVCLELHHYLERAFPMDYARRRKDHADRKEAAVLRQVVEKFRSVECSGEEPALSGTAGILHVGVGCDACGMFPIVGDRFKCRDCAEKIGYDLCGNCHRKGGDVSGRFNQQHKAGHRMEEVRSGHPLQLNMGNGLINRRRHQQQLLADLDDYIDSFIN